MVINSGNDFGDKLTVASISAQLEAMLSDLDKMGLTMTAIRISEALDELRTWLHDDQIAGGMNSCD